MKPKILKHLFITDFYCSSNESDVSMTRPRSLISSTLSSSEFDSKYRAVILRAPWQKEIILNFLEFIGNPFLSDHSYTRCNSPCKSSESLSLDIKKNSLTSSAKILYDHFAGISISPHEILQNLQHHLQNASLRGYFFQVVTENDVILAFYHFKTQARGDDNATERDSQGITSSSS